MYRGVVCGAQNERRRLCCALAIAVLGSPFLALCGVVDVTFAYSPILFVWPCLQRARTPRKVSAAVHAISVYRIVL